MIVYQSRGKLFVRPTSPGEPPREVTPEFLRASAPPQAEGPPPGMRTVQNRHAAVRKVRTHKDVTP